MGLVRISSLKTNVITLWERDLCTYNLLYNVLNNEFLSHIRHFDFTITSSSIPGVPMSKFIPAPEKIIKARALIQKARDLPVPAEGGRSNFSYIAQVKDLLRQARDLVKFIPNSPSTTPEMKADVKKIFEEADQANQEILHG
jgi:hypothetical protein